jgi:hypothetical protein
MGLTTASGFVGIWMGDLGCMSFGRLYHKRGGHTICIGIFIKPLRPFLFESGQALIMIQRHRAEVDLLHKVQMSTKNGFD